MMPDFSVQMPRPKAEYSELMKETAVRSLSTTVR